MAIDAGTVWEIRADGSQVNGGGFYDRDPGTSVDYSQQAAAQLTVADLATDGAGTGLSSATGGFTAAMAGNVVQISGGDLTAGWYEITVHTDTNNVTIDRSAGASKSGGTGNVGGAFDLGGALDDDFFTVFVAGNTCYIRGGSYSLGETVSSTTNGTAAAPIRVIGYNTVRATRPTGTDRPLIACGAFWFDIRTYWSAENLRGTGTSAIGVFFSAAQSTYINCKATNTSGSAAPAFQGSTGSSIWVGCEGISANGYAFLYGHAIQCYAHDSTEGYARPYSVIGSVADTCTTYGMFLDTNSRNINQCTIYNCGTGIYFTTTLNQTSVVNCIIDACTTGINAVAENDLPVVAYCSLDNTTDFAANVDECIQISNRTADPGMNDPANADFSITSADDVYQQGLDVEEWTGATVRS